MQPQRSQDILTALIALTLAACIGAVALSTFQRASASETVCFKFKTVQQMQQERGLW